ncbi:MAG: GNAT family N-acetyltransferase [Gemmatimonadales bacterium]|nr:GNAT family N-acetyltransferase [Gemmatimonadales bacterium]NIN11070.1 GNAT family N-acetyltransferase [Gemmatimonadales bacterium]NIN49667.1 GNAT family N-acetyltransferase [Gemmatimonadales bacterium]NIP07131.1 GNAT family N-acetyltransferase [Gemmatimonadales bacterium]NIQ99522.1 GNAT family N-acetyltransferase [Gemmatimonadales bacterium]
MSVGDAVITLRAPSAADRPRVRESVQATAVFRPDEVAVALEVFDDAIADPEADYTALGAFEDSRLVGFSLYGPTPCTLATWDIYWIVVDPAVQRRGIGRQLMFASEEAIRSRGGRLIVIETSSRPDYGPTRAFYEVLDYTRAAHIADYYAPGDDLIVYTKHLAPPTTETAHHG